MRSARRRERVDAAADALRGSAPAVLARCVDVGDPGSVDAFFGACERELGPATLVVNAAGLSWPGALHEAEAERQERDRHDLNAKEVEHGIPFEEVGAEFLSRDAHDQDDGEDDGRQDGREKEQANESLATGDPDLAERLHAWRAAQSAAIPEIPDEL